ncbi:MAG: NUDIX domain-containing protein [Patescibacteria group bacterium]
MKKEAKKVGAGLGVILIHDGKILLGKRHPDPDKADSAFKSAGEWCLPGGKLDFGETFEQGAIREVKEETGITITNPQVISIHNFKNEHAHFMTVGIIAKSWKGEAKVMEPDEITKWQWFSLKKLPYPRYFPSFGVINNYLKNKFYIKEKVRSYNTRRV